MEKRICRISHEPFVVTDDDLEFYHRVGPVVCSERFPVPAPTLCPRERFRRRLVWRNERHLYRVTCALTGKSIVSSFSPDKPYPVCDRKAWYEFDNTKFGRDFDFSRPFFDQFEELLLETYKPNVSQNGEMENSEFCHFAGVMKNCYMAFDSGFGEDLQYTVFVGYSKDCRDCLLVYASELCYECVKADNCYELFYGLFCLNCSFSAWLTDCIGCSHCLGCINLRNQKHHIFNKPVSPAEFEATWDQIFSGSRARVEEFARKYAEFLTTQPHRPLRNVDCSDVQGDVLIRCENVRDSYHCQECKDLKHCHYCYLKAESCYDINTWGEDMTHCLELSGSGGMMGKVGVANCLFGVYLYYGAYDLLYSVNCLEKCQSLFGCTDLYKKQYCILNKQYSKDEYEKLLFKILNHLQETGEWGEFFPMRLSPYGYNESSAQEELPLTKEEVAAIGGKWSDYVAPSPQVAKIFSSEEIPNSATAFSDALLDGAIRCEASGTLFKLNKKELSFYSTFGLPIPRFAFFERHKKRFEQLNPHILFDGICAETGVPIKTTYPPDRKVKVVSDEFYQKLMS